jgi:rubrerythrin
MAASKTTDGKGKDVLLALAKDELDHFDYLKAHYESIGKTGEAAKKVKMRKPVGFSGKSPIFSSGFKKRISRAHYEMSALSIAISLELSSMNYYRNQAEATNDAILKDFFGKLAIWEASHHEMLVKEHARLQQYYWTENRFYPF